MNDRFFEVINRYMLPMEKLERVVDSSYFLRKNLSFAFAQGYCHPRGGFYGKLINYPDPRGELTIFGRRYSNTNKRLVNNVLTLIPIGEQLELHFRADPSLRKREGIPPFAEYHTVFTLSDCCGYFEHRHSLRVAMEMYPWLPPKIEKLSDFLGIPQERLGTTGSLAYGRIEDAAEGDDIDLTICGSIEEHRRVLATIRKWITNPAHRVFEFNKFWPMRFFLDGTLICPFFIYERPDEIPLSDFTMELVNEGVTFRGRVSGDRHAIYLPMLLRMEGVCVNGEKTGDMPLIIYDSSVRGEFVRGDLLEGRGKLVRVSTPGDTFPALLVTNGETMRSTGNGSRS